MGKKYPIVISNTKDQISKNKLIHIQELFEENINTMWKDIPCSRIGGSNIIKILFNSKLMYKEFELKYLHMFKILYNLIQKFM